VNHSLNCAARFRYVLATGYHFRVGKRVYQLGGGTPAQAGNNNWPVALTSDAVANQSGVPGASVSAALGDLQLQIARMQAVMPAPTLPPPGGYDLTWDFDPNVATNPDLLANGWNVTLTNSPYTVITRSGDVVSYESYLTTNDGVAYDPTPATNTYRSTLRDGRLLVQTARGQDISIWRTTDAAARLYSIGVGGGPRDNNVRQAWISNGAPGAANVLGLAMGDSGSPITYGVATPFTAAAAAGAAAAAKNFFFNVPDLSVSGNGIGKWIQATVYDLWPQSAPANTGNLIQMDFGVGARPQTERVGLRLRTEFAFNNGGNADRHFEIYYLRRQPWRAQWR
jgi:hypothetical protein